MKLEFRTGLEYLRENANKESCIYKVGNVHRVIFLWDNDISKCEMIEDLVRGLK